MTPMTVPELRQIVADASRAAERLSHRCIAMHDSSALGNVAGDLERIARELEAVGDPEMTQGSKRAT